MVNAYGIINERTGSYTLAMLPLAALCVAGVSRCSLWRQARRAQLHEKHVTPLTMTEAGHLSPLLRLKIFFRRVARFHQRTADRRAAGAHFLRQTACSRLHQLPYFLSRRSSVSPRWGRSGLTPQPACRERRRQASKRSGMGVRARLTCRMGVQRLPPAGFH